MGARCLGTFALPLVCALTLGTAGCQKQTIDTSTPASSRPVSGKFGDPAALQQDDGQWVMPAKNYASTRFSGLTEINTDTVRQIETERRVRLGVADAATRLFPVLLLAFCAAFVSAGDSGRAAASEAEALTGGSVDRGKAAIGKYGCGSCHTIPGIDGAEATVGPPLTGIAVRGYLAGHLTNSPDNMMKWIQHPQRIDPQVVMPEMGITDQDARDITAYLYTLR